jgi:ERCC4-type nuclease
LGEISETPVLRVDTREPPRLAELLAERVTIPILIEQLKTGDYVCEDICIERKTINDFARSIIRFRKGEGRMWGQGKRMTEEFAHRYLLVSGTFKNMTVHINHNSVLAALARLLSSGVSVCFGLDNDRELVYLICKILEKHGKMKGLKDMKKKKKIKPSAEAMFRFEVKAGEDRKV